jgi:Uncharacterised nucleotidyltransferase
VTDSLLDQLNEALAALREADIPVAAIGGLALNAHGYMRATHDLDFLVQGDDADRAALVLNRLGYATLDRREDLSTFTRGAQRIDFLHARRPISQRLLAEACARRDDSAMAVVSVEGVIGLKIQAFSDDPRRLHDLGDIIELLKLHRGRLNTGQLREYFALFGQEALLDELLAAVDRS